MVKNLEINRRIEAKNPDDIPKGNFTSDAEAHYDIDGVSYWNGKVIVASGEINDIEKPLAVNTLKNILGKIDQ